MKKTYELSHPKIKVARLIEAAKHDLKKYMKRERRKALPEGADFWGFDCKYGIDEASAKTIHAAEMNKCIDEAESQALPSFYLEIRSKPMFSDKVSTDKHLEQSDLDNNANDD